MAEAKKTTAKKTTTSKTAESQEQPKSDQGSVSTDVAGTPASVVPGEPNVDETGKVVVPEALKSVPSDVLNPAFAPKDDSK